MHNPEVIIPLITGFVLDSLIGDPHWMPHPIRVFGNMITWGEKRLNKGNRRKLKGALMSLVLIGIVYFIFASFLNLIKEWQNLSLLISSLLVFFALANHSLIKESLWVIKALNKKGLEAGRKQLSMIVGRDTKNLSENEIRTAVLETLSENLSDGVIAPLFFYFIGGIPLMFIYKMINTLDSMIGYKSERFRDFGFFAAKLDDVLNYIPARLTAGLMVLVSFSYRGVKFIFRYGNKHSSPNSGYPESALAGILDCRFGGPNIYGGIKVDKPYIGKKARDIYNKDIYKAGLINTLSTMLFIVLYLIFSYYI